MSNDEHQLTDAEIARRRDEVIRRMANTPPQPKPKKIDGAVPSKKRGRSKNLKTGGDVNGVS
jgi:hypothetical protein